MGGQSREFSLRGGSHRPKHPPQERVAASVGLPGGGSPAVTPRSCWEASPQRQLPTAAREGGRGRSRPGSPAEIQFPCGAGFPWNDSPQGSTLAEARQLGNTNRTLRKSFLTPLNCLKEFIQGVCTRKRAISRDKFYIRNTCMVSQNMPIKYLLSSPS